MVASKRSRIPFEDNHNDETCVNGYKPETMQQPSMWWGPSSPYPKRQDKLAPLYRVLFLHSCSYRQKCVAKIRYKVEFGQCTCSLCCLCAQISGYKQNEHCSACLWLVSEVVSSRFSANVPSILIFSKDNKLWPSLCNFPCLLSSLLF